jgi:Acyl-CoA carboxylase epsilon subunit
MKKSAVSADTSADITVVSGSPSDAELAAVTVVLRSVLAELALQNEIRAHGGMSAWQRSQRPLRGSESSTNWRSFSG